MLCSQEWYQKHKGDYTQEDIDALGIEISIGEKKYPRIHYGGQSDRVKELLSLNKEGGINGRTKSLGT